MFAPPTRVDRRWLHRVLLWVIAAVMCVPVLFGSAYLPAMRALGLDAVHSCACGMEKGTCGCPECEELEKGEAHAREAGIAIVKKTCRDDDSAVGTGSLPMVEAADVIALVPPVLPDTNVSPLPMSALLSRPPAGPSPPPPRV